MSDAKNAAFVSDEIYHGLEYEQAAVSALEICALGTRKSDIFWLGSFKI